MFSDTDLGLQCVNFGAKEHYKYFFLRVNIFKSLRNIMLSNYSFNFIYQRV